MGWLVIRDWTTGSKASRQWGIGPLALGAQAQQTSGARGGEQARWCARLAAMGAGGLRAW